MKKITIVLLATMMALSVSACGSSSSNDNSETTVAETTTAQVETTAAPQVEDTSLDSIIEGILTDVDSTIKDLKDELDIANEKVGDTFDDYVENKNYIYDWFDLCITTEDELFSRTYDASIEYYKLLADTADHDDFDAIDAAFDDIYDKVINEALDNFYNEIVNEALDDAFDRYYNNDGIIDIAYGDVDYSTWIDEASEFYSKWSDSYSALYRGWSDEYSILYRNWSDLWGAFLFQDNFDVDAILEESEKERMENETEEATEAVTEEATEEETEAEAEIETEASNEDSTGVSAEFKGMMDAYEDFFDEYVEFMQKYNNSGDLSTAESLKMLSDFADYMTRYAEAMEELENLDQSEWTSEEVKYYLDVMNRVTQKILTVAQ